MSKKSQAVWTIVQHSVLGAGAAAIPTPGFETHKHVALSTNEIAMCVRIASIYAEIDFTIDEVKALLKESGFAVVSGGALAVVATKVGHGVVNEILNFVPVVGWGIKGILAGSLTTGVGWTFLKFSEARWS